MPVRKDDEVKVVRGPYRARVLCARLSAAGARAALRDALACADTSRRCAVREGKVVQVHRKR